MNRLISLPFALALIALGTAYAQPGGPTPGGPSVLSDTQLINAVRLAAKTRIAPDVVEARVRQAAVVNTRRPGDRNVLAVANISFDPSRASQAKSLDGVDVVYWKRPVSSQDVEIVGITWQKSGAAAYFFGIVRPPE